MTVNILRLPIFWVLVFATLMVGVDAASSLTDVSVSGRFVWVTLFLSSGCALVGIGGNLFLRVGTTLNPLHPEQTTHLVTGGLYAVTRNPMYLGFLCWLLAVALFTSDALNFVLLPVFVLLVNKRYIVPEERALENLFGNDFVVYKENVRRWL